MSFTYDYPRPALTVDCVVFGLDEGALKILLIERGEKPFKGRWALPGGFVHMDETLDAAAARELREETGLTKVFLEQLCTFGAVERDPRGRVVTVAYYALVNRVRHQPTASTDASAAAWFAIRDLPALAFDHKHVVDGAIGRLRSKLRYAPIGFELLPTKFSLTQLQRVYETILERELDKRNFRKKVLGFDLLIDTGEKEKNVPRRKAQLYRFDRKKYKQLTRSGLNFEI